MRSFKKTILIITQCFPPHGGSGVQRPLFFSKYLSELGWECIVLTTSEANHPIHDKSLCEHIHETTKVIRVNCPPIPELLYNKCTKIDRYIAKLLSKIPFIWKYGNKASKATRTLFRPIIRFLSIPDDIVGNLPKLVWHGSLVTLKYRPDIILSTSPPPTMHLTGFILSRLAMISWIADLRDEWTLNPLMTYPEKIYKKYDKFLEKFVLKRSNKIIATTDRIASDTAKETGINPKKFIIITNGHTIDAPLIKLETESKNNNHLNFTHSGTLLKDRNPLLWITVFENFIRDNKIHDITLHFIGDTRSFDTTLNKRWIKQHGYLPHHECLQKLISSDVLILISGFVSTRCYPGKVFEYLALGKPILAICPKNSATYSFLSTMDHCYLADINTPSSITKQLSTVYHLWKTRKLPYRIKRSESIAYHRRELTKKLNSILLEEISRY